MKDNDRGGLRSSGDLWKIVNNNDVFKHILSETMRTCEIFEVLSLLAESERSHALHGDKVLMIVFGEETRQSA